MAYTDLLKGRYSEPQRTYFVTSITHQRIPVFSDLYLARTLVQALKKSDSDKSTTTLAWVIMPDHFHWLFQLEQKTDLSKVIKNIKGRSAYEINKQAGITGKLWQKQYYDRAIRINENIKQIARYIIANPLRAGLVKNITDYPHWDAIWLE
jgi:putative transposase